MIEKRAVKRFTVSCQIGVSLEVGTENMDTHLYLTKDLSSNGAFVSASDHYFRMNDLVSMEIMMPQKTLDEGDWQRSKLLARGRVIRTEPQGFAVAFTSRGRLVTAEGQTS